MVWLVHCGCFIYCVSGGLTVVVIVVVIICVFYYRCGRVTITGVAAVHLFVVTTVLGCLLMFPVAGCVG